MNISECRAYYCRVRTRFSDKRAQCTHVFSTTYHSYILEECTEKMAGAQVQNIRAPKGSQNKRLVCTVRSGTMGLLVAPVYF